MSTERTYNVIVKVMVLVAILAFSGIALAGPEASYPDVRITTEAEGMYYISAAELALVLGVSDTEVEGVLISGTVNLLNGGEQVARMISPDGAGIYFYAEALSTIYTARNVYFIAWETGIDMGTVAGVAPAYVPGGTYRASVKVEQNVMAVTGALNDQDKDFWVWDRYVANDSSYGTNEYEIVLSSVGTEGTQAVINVRLLGWTDTGVAQEHHVAISINSNAVGDIYWTGKTEKLASLPFDPNFLLDGTNDIRVVAVLDGGVTDNQFYLDYIEVEYNRSFDAVSDQLHISSTTSIVVSVTGLTGSNVFVADVSTPLTPGLLSGVLVEPSNSLYVASFAPSNDLSSYVVFEGSGGLVADGIAPVSGADLTAVSNDAEYVIITVEDLRPAADTLAAYRQVQRLNSQVVLLQDVYDQFNNGIADPSAIKDFVGYAYSNWVNSLRYVVLGGSGTYDYKGSIHDYADQHIPAKLLSLKQGLTASDTWYGDIDGDWVMDVAIGRLPAVTADDMTNLVARIIAHEGQQGSPWRQTVILCADNPDSGGNFHASSDEVASLVAGEYTQATIHMSSGGEAVASNQLRTAMNNGALFMSYIGHAGIYSITSEDILTIWDVPDLLNSNRLPVVTSMSCAMGRYELPEFDCLGEALMLGQSGGAIAVLAPSTTAKNSDSVLMSKEFYKKVFSNKEWILGDAVKAAMEAYGAKKKAPELLRFYNLLGDPALYLAELGAPTDDPFGAVLPEVVEWKTTCFAAHDPGLDDTEISGDFSDPDGDGLPNIVEYVLNRNPVSSESSSILGVTEAEVQISRDYDVVVSYSRRKSFNGLYCSLRRSSDLYNWEPADPYIVHTRTVDDGNGVSETISHYLDWDDEAPKNFVTLVIGKE